MQVYLVGGAVRDELLNIPVIENDYVVVGATFDDMLSKGYQKVGKDFPVFLHPKTKEEYALARTERKTATGYYGFECNFSSTVTLEEDLKRRDITINAIAKDKNGKLIDPYCGQQDLHKKIIRHISDSFVEDPLRVLRVARFKAKLHHLGFNIAPETAELMKEIVAAGEIDSLTKERVWQEFYKSLREKSPQQFFISLRECGALKIIFPELDKLWGVPQTEKYHPEIDTGIHVMKSIEEACKLTDDLETRFAVVCHDLGKGVTPKDMLPSHRGHDLAGVKIIKQLPKQLNAPKLFIEIAECVSKYHIQMHSMLNDLKGTPKICLNILEGIDAFRKPDRLDKFIIACYADLKGRKGFELEGFSFDLTAEQLMQFRKSALEQFERGKILKQAYIVAKKISVESIDKSLTGKDIGTAISKKRISAIASYINSLDIRA